MKTSRKSRIYLYLQVQCINKTFLYRNCILITCRRDSNNVTTPNTTVFYDLQGTNKDLIVSRELYCRMTSQHRSSHCRQIWYRQSYKRLTITSNLGGYQAKRFRSLPNDFMPYIQCHREDFCVLNLHLFTMKSFRLILNEFVAFETVNY